jgi:hypothetical protein
MKEVHSPTENHAEAKIYEIRIKGHLDSRWVNWFEEMTISLEEDGNSLLTGMVVDQAALYGLLKKVRDVGVTLLSVKCYGPGPSKPLPLRELRGTGQAEVSKVK